MARRCSHCSNNGHNSRTCPTRCGGGGGSGGIGGGGGGGMGVKLFGVRLTDGSIIKKSASMGNLSLAAHHHSSSSAAVSPNHHPASPNSDHNNHRDADANASSSMIHVSDGYVSDDPTAHASCSTNRRGDRKKGIAWTVEEHRMFLTGLQKMGKGDWRGIARNYVMSRTPTQVASHAQKYFIRHSNSTRKKRRSSLFDMVAETAMDTAPVPEEQPLDPSPQPQEKEIDNTNSVSSLDLSLELVETTSYKPMETTSYKPTETTSYKHMETTSYKPMETTSYKPPEAPEEYAESFINIPPLVPTYYPAYVIPVMFPVWPTNWAHAEEVEDEKVETSHHQVLKPIPVVPKQPVNVDELVGMSKLNLEEAKQLKKSDSALSLKLLETSRQSAFHANAPANVPDTKDGESSTIQAVLTG